MIKLFPARESLVIDIPAGDGKTFFTEMKNSAYNQEKQASAPPPPLYEQEAGRESNQGSSRNQSPQLYATTSLYQTAVIQDEQEVGVCETEYFSSFFSEKCFFCFLR
jgi:hypothetical protein